MKRCAIYFAPPQDSPLTELAAAWLGRDAWREGGVLPEPPIHGFAQEVWHAATADPRVYGFHATLKPPFRLRPEFTEDDVLRAAEEFARKQQSFDAPRLRFSSLSHFIALTLSEPSEELNALAARSVEEFDRFRLPPSDAELARRRSPRLNEKHLAYLERWGYPYVMDEWRFHMTLTSSLESPLFEEIGAHLRELFAPHCADPLRVDAICVFTQPGEGEPFTIARRFPFP